MVYLLPPLPLAKARAYSRGQVKAGPPKMLIPMASFNPAAPVSLENIARGISMRFSSQGPVPPPPIRGKP